MSTFANLGVPADLSAALERQGITEPFPIQAATLPDALAGHDVCGKAPTGSGKTLAFGLAMVLRVERARPRLPRGLVLVPTRELASQVAAELEPLARTRGLRVVAIYGGASMENQRKLLNRGADIVVATPGRLEDFLERRTLGLEDVSVAVLDEADRMADMGFTPAVQRILDATRPNRQILLFSATLDGDVDKLVKRYLNKPRRHDVLGNEEDKGDVIHLFWRSRREERVEMAANLIDRHERAIVFCRTRHGAERLSKQLAQAGVGAAAIHGARSQSQRERALADFKSGRVKALVATDVAARGIHVDAVPCVIHFDPPADHKDYTHRSGRTGRAGATGVVVSLVGDEHRSAIKVLQRNLGFPSQVDPADKFAVRTAKPIVVSHRPEPSRPGERPRYGKPTSGGHGQGGARARTGASGRPGSKSSGGSSGGGSGSYGAQGSSGAARSKPGGSTGRPFANRNQRSGGSKSRG